MTSTMVLGRARRTRSRYAVSILSPHPEVRHVATRSASTKPEHAVPDLPEGWQAVATLDLTRALLSSRTPVLVDDLPTWVEATLDTENLWDDAEAARTRLHELTDELCLALSAVPFETAALTCDPDHRHDLDPERAELWSELLEHVNARVSEVATFVHEVRGGRVLDLSDAPPAYRP